MRIVYHPKLVFGSAFLNRFHPFEFDRADRALEVLREHHGEELEQHLCSPESPVSLEQLSSVHDHSYIKSLAKGSTIARVLEVSFLAWLPRRWLNHWFLEPARWSVAASVLGARMALEHGLAVSLGGGFHHAKRSGGEGFCLVSDVAYLVHVLREDGSLQKDDRLLYIDLDVHQGNGVSDYYAHSSEVRLLDLYNEEIYPVYGGDVSAEVSIARPLPPGCSDELYLDTLRPALEELMEGWESSRLLIYNAGNDVFKEDRLGGFHLSREGVKERDRLVLSAARERGIPTVVLASGGYSQMSATLLADLATTGLHIYG